MEYSSFTAEDFAMEASFRNYCLKINPNDVVFWEQWLLENPAKHAIVQQAKELVLLLSGSHPEGQLSRDREHFKLMIAQHLQKPEEQLAPVVTLKSRKKYLLGAAVAAALVTVAALVFINKKPPRPFRDEQVYSHAGEKKVFYLPDSTKVILNAGSKVQVAERFNEHSREISLEGEAFFEVTHNRQKPFIIHTKLMDIRVLGTTFNVKSYTEDNIAETSLLEGSVEVTMKHTKEKVLLKPNEKIVLPQSAATTKTAAPEAAEPIQQFSIAHLTYDKTDSSLAEVSWTESRLVFNDQNFEELARTLSRWYNVDIEFTDEDVKSFRFTATFKQKSIVQVLEALRLSRNFKYSNNANKITIGK